MKYLGLITGLIVSFALGIFVVYNHDNPLYMLFGVVLCFGYYLHTIVLAHVYALHKEECSDKDLVALAMTASMARFLYFGLICIIGWIV